jgi:hypothetical protein
MRVSRCFDLHPGFEGAAHVFEGGVARAVGDEGGQAVEDFKFEGFAAQVAEGDAAGEGGEGLAGTMKYKTLVSSPRPGCVSRISTSFMPTSISRLDFAGVPTGKWFVIFGLFAAPQVDEGAEAERAGLLVGFVGGLEFHDGVVFAFDAKPGDGLAAVDVKNPERDAKRAGNAGQEGGEGARLLEIGQAEAPERVEMVRFFQLSIGFILSSPAIQTASSRLKWHCDRLRARHRMS